MGEFDLTLGVLFVGMVFNTYLYGIVTLQFSSYCRTCAPSDRLSLKLVVMLLFVLDTVHSFIVVYMGWVYCVSNYNKPEILKFAIWPYCFTPPATAAAAMIVHFYLGLRVHRLLENKCIYGLIMAASFASFVLGVYCGAMSWIIREVSKFDVLDKPMAAWLSLQAGVDLTLSSLLIYCLVKLKTGFIETDCIVNKTIRGAIRTGVFAALFALIDLLVFIKFDNTNLYGLFAIPIGRIYTNTLLDTLLARNNLRSKLASSVNGVNLNNIRSREEDDMHWLRNMDLRRANNNHIVITVQSTVEPFGEYTQPTKLRERRSTVT